MNRDAKKILRMVSLSVFFLFIIIYAFFRSKELLLGIRIRDVNLQDGIKLPQSSFEITGRAKNATNLYLNGREISVDQKGNFREYLSFLSGYNIVNIKAKDKFGHVDEKNYHIIADTH